MKTALNTKVGKEFRPSQQFKSLYYIYLMLGTLFGILPWCIPLVYFIGQASEQCSVCSYFCRFSASSDSFDFRSLLDSKILRYDALQTY